MHDYRKLVKVYCVRIKDELHDCLVQYINEVHHLTGKMIKELKCDNGKEYMNTRILKYTRETGILIKSCPACVHELNGTPGRYNRSLLDMGRCLLSETKAEKKYWPELIKSAAYFKNRILTNTVKGKRP